MADSCFTWFLNCSISSGCEQNKMRRWSVLFSVCIPCLHLLWTCLLTEAPIPGRPGSPGGPGGPWNPWGPCMEFPDSPFWPGGPAGPRAPRVPGMPGSPVTTIVDPGGPGFPLSPFGPRGPWDDPKDKKHKYYFRIPWFINLPGTSITESCPHAKRKTDFIYQPVKQFITGLPMEPSTHLLLPSIPPGPVLLFVPVSPVVLGAREDPVVLGDCSELSWMQAPAEVSLKNGKEINQLEML